MNIVKMDDATYKCHAYFSSDAHREQVKKKLWYTFDLTLCYNAIRSAPSLQGKKLTAGRCMMVSKGEKIDWI